MANAASVLEPPPALDREYVRACLAWSRILLVLAGAVALLGLVILGSSVLGFLPSPSAELLGIGGTLVTTTTSVFLTASWKRAERAKSLPLLLARWEQLFQARDPSNQIPAFSKLYTSMIRQGLGPI